MGFPPVHDCAWVGTIKVLFRQFCCIFYRQPEWFTTMKINPNSPITFILLLMLLLLPNALLTYWGQQPYEILITATLLLLSLAGCLKKVRRLWFFLPFVAILPLYLPYIIQYHTFINEHILAVLSETNWEEARGYIGYVPVWFMILGVVWLAFFVWLSQNLWRSQWTWQHRSRYWVMIATVCYVAYYYTDARIAGKHTGELIQTQQQIEAEWQAQQNDFLKKNLTPLFTEIQSNYPFGLGVSFYRWRDNVQAIKQIANQVADFRFQAASHSPNQQEIVVLVIGESARRANWQIHGYERPTNPLLSQQSNLLPLDKMQSLADHTRIAVPMMLTRKPAEQVYSFAFAEKSVISAFKEAGFQTYWLSNQQQNGSFDNSISVYAQEADKAIYVNLAGYQYDKNYDARLLPKLADILAEPHHKKFIVIHTMGSHTDYAHRYPKEDAVFLPDLHGLEKYGIRSMQYQQELRNGFDNTIVYTDKILNNVIEQLKQQNQPAFLLFSSDHGEDLLTDGCDLAGHGNGSLMNHEVATFAWYSDAYQQAFPQKIAQLNDNRHKTMNHTVLFATLLDSVDITVGNGKLSGSLLQPFDEMSSVKIKNQCDGTQHHIGLF